MHDALNSLYQYLPKSSQPDKIFFNHGWTRINTDEVGLSLIRVHPSRPTFGVRRHARLRCASTRPSELQLAAPKPEAKAGAQRRRRFGSSPSRNRRPAQARDDRIVQSGVALRFPPHSKCWSRRSCGARLSEPQHVDCLVLINLPRASCLAKLLRVTDSRSGARLCEPQRVGTPRAVRFNPASGQVRGRCGWPCGHGRAPLVAASPRWAV